MKIDVRKLKYSGLTTTDFSFKYTPESNISDFTNTAFNDVINVYGSLELHTDDVYVDITVECAIVGGCARCLKDTEYHFKEVAELKFVRDNPGVFDYTYKSGVVDLTDAVNDVILTNLPTQILCSENCKGLCAHCGINLNESSCNCEK
jgi:uncharacterized protein